MQGIEAQSRHPGLLTPSSARLRPALVVTSSFIEHGKTEHQFLTYLLSPIVEFSEVQNSTICLVIYLLGVGRRILRSWSPGPGALAGTSIRGPDAFQRGLG